MLLDAANNIALLINSATYDRNEYANVESLAHFEYQTWDATTTLAYVLDEVSHITRGPLKKKKGRRRRATLYAESNPLRPYQSSFPTR